MTLLLGAFALSSVNPWERESIGPELGVVPGLGVEMAVGDSVAVASGGALAGAGLEVADARRATLVAERGRPRPGTAVELGVSAAQPVASVPVSSPPSSPQPQPQPVSVPEPAPIPAPVVVPVAGPPTQPSPPPILAGIDEGGEEPGTAGVGEFGPVEVCDGDEYALALLLYIESVLGEDPDQTLAMHVAGAETESTVYIEGASVGVVELVDLLLAEGECLTITVEVAAPV